MLAPKQKLPTDMKKYQNGSEKTKMTMIAVCSIIYYEESILNTLKQPPS
jgi:hypothetical protein